VALAAGIQVEDGGVDQSVSRHPASARSTPAPATDPRPPPHEPDQDRPGTGRRSHRRSPGCGDAASPGCGADTAPSACAPTQGPDPRPAPAGKEHPRRLSLPLHASRQPGRECGQTAHNAATPRPTAGIDAPTAVTRRRGATGWPPSARAAPSVDGARGRRSGGGCRVRGGVAPGQRGRSHREASDRSSAARFGYGVVGGSPGVGDVHDEVSGLLEYAEGQSGS
jgi:hypothetical protein